MFGFDDKNREDQFMKHYSVANCVAAKDTWVQGTYSSAFGRLLVIRLNKCSDREDCRSDEEIDNFFRGRYLQIWYN